MAERQKKDPALYPIVWGLFSFVGFLALILFLSGSFDKSPSVNIPFQPGFVDYETLNIPPYYGAGDYTAPTNLNDYKQSVLTFTGWRDYYLYPSASLDTEKPVTFILLLHGAKRDGRSMIDKWKDIVDDYNMVIAAPNSEGEGWQPSSDPVNVFNRIAGNAAADLGVTFDKKFAFGHSSGARHIITMANHYPNAWCAVSANAGFPDAGQIPNDNPDAPPVQMLLGTRDHIFDLDDANIIASTLARHGHSVEFIKMPSQTHWYYAAADIINRKALDFFMKQNCDRH